jgi:hypothetical protein
MNNYKIIEVPIKGCPHNFRQFCTIFSEAYLKHSDPIVDRDIISNHIEVIHNNKKVRAGIDKDIQKAGRKDLVYYNDTDYNTEYDHLIEDDVFLLHDDVGFNYAHFFFDYFGRCLYFDELRKTNPNLKLGVLENFYKEDGNSSFIKEWLNLYYQDQNVDIIVFKKNERYKLKNELELIDKIKNELNYDIIELMDCSLIEKIQIFKSYKNIIHQSSASNLNVFFSTPNNNNIIISHPVMESWLNYKCSQFASRSGSNLLTLDGGGKCISTLEETNQTNKDNIPWMLEDIDGLIEILKQVDRGDIWES